MQIFKILSNLIIFDGDFTNFEEIGDVYNGIMAIFCVVCAGLAAGLTIGLLSLDVTKLEIKSMTGNNNEKKAALQVLPVVKKHHLLLVTLLLFNSLANETLPIFLGALVPNYVAVILSVTLVLFFGEIIPSAIFTGPDQLLTAARMTGFVYFLVGFFYPVAYPISRLLDYILGNDESSGSITRTELEALVILQGKHSTATTNAKHDVKHVSYSEQYDEERQTHRTGSGTDYITISTDDSNEELGEGQEDRMGLSNHEINLMTGILRLSKLSISNAMIKLSKVYMLSSDTQLDEKGLCNILDSGFSRILVHRTGDKSHLMGYLLVKELIMINSSDNIRAESLTLREPLFVQPSTGLLEMLNIFQSGQCHLAVVSANPEEALHSLRSGTRCNATAGVIGIVTLEDIIERIIQNDIRDETDHCTPRSSGSGKWNHLTSFEVLAKNAASSSQSTANQLGSTTVLFQKLIKVNSRKKLASCPDLLNSPVLYGRKRSGSSTSGKRRPPLWPSSRAVDDPQGQTVGLPFDEDEETADQRSNAYMSDSYQNIPPPPPRVKNDFEGLEMETTTRNKSLLTKD